MFSSSRNLGYGAANTAARVGSIVSPYAFAMVSGYRDRGS